MADLGASRKAGPAVASLKICIIGAGMGGLTCALALAKAGFTNISVYEYASDLGFVGAGIQLAPNMARILDRLGVWTDIEREAVILNDTSIRQGSTDNELGHVELDYVKPMYGFPHMVGHRSSLAGSIYKGCLQHSDAIKFHFSTSVDNIDLSDPSQPSFIATPRKGGEEPYKVTASLLLGCDGVKSRVRTALLSQLNGPSSTESVVDTGQAAYRIMLTRAQIASANDPELMALLDGPTATRWIGEKRHIIAYPVSNHEIYNMSTAQPDANFAAAPSATYTTRGSKSEMLKVYDDFCPKVQKLLALVPEGEVCEWKLRVHNPLPTWLYGCTALVGDACHPTLPHLAQGAAQAIEDAAVLGTVLPYLSSTDPTQIQKALGVYESVRKSRAETLVETAAASGRAMHLGEGRDKEERDRAFAALQSSGGKGPVPDKWADADVQRMIYGHDCAAVASEEAEKVLT